jgi:hypothetical protein
MAAFLFVTASVAVVMGLVGLVAGHMPWTTGRQRLPRASGPAREQSLTVNGRRDGRLSGGGQLS